MAGRFLGCFALLLFGTASYACISDLYHGRISKGWLPVLALVKSDHINANNNGVDMEYTYAVNGTGFEGHRIQFGFEILPLNIEQLNTYVKRHRGDSSVVVYFDPTDHRQSVLIRGWHPYVMELLPFCIIVTVYALLLVIFPVRALLPIVTLTVAVFDLESHWKWLHKRFTL